MGGLNNCLVVNVYSLLLELPQQLSYTRKDKLSSNVIENKMSIIAPLGDSNIISKAASENPLSGVAGKGLFTTEYVSQSQNSNNNSNSATNMIVSRAVSLLKVVFGTVMRLVLRMLRLLWRMGHKLFSSSKLQTSR